jgi:NTP pyrophosphatase (non-canonical NTP hydrolase)
MLVKDYLAFTDTTAIYPGAGTSNNGEVAYLTLGLVGESLEFLDKVHGPGADQDVYLQLLELGDVAWYLMRLTPMWGISHELTDQTISVNYELSGNVRDLKLHHAATALAVHTGKLAERSKKLLRGDDLSTKVEAIAHEVLTVVSLWTYVCRALGVTPSEALVSNVKKLSDRKERGVLKGSGDTR